MINCSCHEYQLSEEISFQLLLKDQCLEYGDITEMTNQI